MSYRRKITLKDGRKLNILVSDGYIIIRYGCRCGKGLSLNLNAYVGYCSWYNEWYDLKHEFVDEIREILETKKPITVQSKGCGQ